MTTREAGSHKHIVLILMSVLVGAAVTFVVLYGQHIGATPRAVDAQVDALALENSFVNIAEAAMPAVVNITSKSTQTMAGGHPQVPDEFREFFEDPFFRPFRRDAEEGGEGGEGGDEGAAPDAEVEPAPRMPRGMPGRMPARSMGSGWIYSDDGYIVTNSHVIKGATDIRVKLYDDENDDKQYKATVVGSDPRTELAVLKIDVDRKLPTLKVGSSDETRVGQWVMAVGSPFELEQTVTVGVVSAMGRQINPPDAVFRLGDIVQTDASINPGNSGGPLINLRGEVVGVNVAIVAPGLPGNVGIGFAIAADTVKRIVPQLRDDGHVSRGWLGIAIGELDNANMRDHFKAPNGGVLVEQIRDDGPAQDSDLQAEDVIVAVGGAPVRDTWTLQKAVMVHKPGEEITLDVVRDGKEIEVALVLGGMPAEFQGEEKPAEEPEDTEDGEETGVLGMKLGEITEQLADERNLAENAGVYVEEVDPGSEAFERGIRPGDVIVKVNTTEVKTLEDVTTVVDTVRAANDGYVILRIARKTPDGERQLITIDLTP